MTENKGLPPNPPQEPVTPFSDVQVHRLALKLPGFWDNHPDLWFANIEAQFETSGITQDSTKFYHVVSALTSDIMSHVSDIVLTPPETEKYESLKTRLISDFSDSEQRKLKALTTELELGDDKPSHLLRKMRRMSGKLEDEFLKNLWLQRLPLHIQAALSTSEDDLKKLAIKADKIHDLTGTRVNELSIKVPQAEVSELRAQVAELNKKLDRFSMRDQGNSRGQRRRSFSRPRNRPRSPFRECWYHWKFGDRAERCLSPCRHKTGQPPQKN